KYHFVASTCYFTKYIRRLCKICRFFLWITSWPAGTDKYLVSAPCSGYKGRAIKNLKQIGDFFMSLERTFSIIKPDGTRRNLTGAINRKFEDAGLRIVAQRRIK